MCACACCPVVCNNEVGKSASEFTVVPRADTLAPNSLAHTTTNNNKVEARKGERTHSLTRVLYLCACMRVDLFLACVHKWFLVCFVVGCWVGWRVLIFFSLSFFLVPLWQSTRNNGEMKPTTKHRPNTPKGNNTQKRHATTQHTRKHTRAPIAY